VAARRIRFPAGRSWSGRRDWQVQILRARHYSTVSVVGRRAFDPATYSLSGFFLAHLAIGVLGVTSPTLGEGEVAARG
jgi:hypothetical protein